MTLTTLNIGGDDYQSYATVDEADKFLRVDSAKSGAWSALDADGKASRLAESTRLIDDAGEYSGEPVSSSQTTAWPRTGALCNGEAVVKPLPDDIVEATISLAGAIAANPAATGGTSPSTGIQTKRLKSGEDEIEFFEQGAAAAAAAAAAEATQVRVLVPDPLADRLIRCFLTTARGGAGLSGGGFATGRAFGTDATSTFTDPGKYDKRTW